MEELRPDLERLFPRLLRRSVKEPVELLDLTGEQTSPVVHPHDDLVPGVSPYEDNLGTVGGREDPVRREY